MMEDDSIDGSYNIPIKEEYVKKTVRKTVYEQMINYIKCHDMTTGMDLTRQFGTGGNVQRAISMLINDKRIIKKNCETGRCSWYEFNNN